MRQVLFRDEDAVASSRRRGKPNRRTPFSVAAPGGSAKWEKYGSVFGKRCVRMLAGLLFAGSALAQCTSYSGSLVMEIDRTKLPTTQTSFPVLLQGTNATLKTQANGGQLQSSSGYDICYSDVTNTMSYTWRLLAYTATTGAFTHRVQVPIVNGMTASRDTQFLMWYGKSGQNAPTGSPFDTNTIGAWYMGDGSSVVLTDRSEERRVGKECR